MPLAAQDRAAKTGDLRAVSLAFHADLLSVGRYIHGAVAVAPAP